MLRSGDFVARRSSDEFAIALVGINNLGDVMAFTNRLVEAPRPPLCVGDREFVCTTSVGIALAPSDGDTAPALLRHADIAWRAPRPTAASACASSSRAMTRRFSGGAWSSMS
jgi:GGDEF domain-containing protein